MPNLLATLGARIKAASTALVHPGGYYGPATVPGQFYPNFIPADATGNVVNLHRDEADPADCGEPWLNSATAIALGWVTSNFPEADLVVEGRKGDDWARRDDDPMVALLDDPIPSFGAFDFHAVWGSALLGCLLDGNAYWYKARDRTGAVRELWPLPHHRIEPFRPDPAAPDYRYRYRVPVAGRPDFIQDFEASEIVQFKWGLPDPDNDLKSIAPHKRCLMERASDTQVSRFTASILQNQGVPGIVVVYEDLLEAPATARELDEVKREMSWSTTGRNRGRPLFMKGKVRLEKVSYSPNEMALNEISRIPEARICASLGVPPMVLGLSVGDHQKTYSNLAEAERQAWRKLRAVQGRMAEALYRQLLPDFEPDRRDLRVRFDYSRVDALQEDRDAVSKRAIAEFQGGLISKNEGRAALGKPPVEGGDDVWWTSQNPNEGATLAAPATPAAKALELKAARVLDRLEAELDDADRPGGRGGLAPIPDRPPGAGPAQILDARGRPVRAAGQPAWAPEWRADQVADGGDISGDAILREAMAGGSTPGDDPDDPAEPGVVRPPAGDPTGGGDDQVPPRGGVADAQWPGAGVGLDAEPPGQ